MTFGVQIQDRAGELEQVRNFALWSRAYDDAPNPMLSLEERFLAPSLPPLSDKDVFDIGCGTGRWLQRLAGAGERTLTGIDFSDEMLACAKRKLDGRAQIAVGNASALPVASSAADVVLASFVASYVPNLEAFARELRRVARPHASLYLSDVHPETAAACHWKRSFRSEQGHAELLSYARSVPEMLECFRAAGFRIACCLEPSFGDWEYETLRRAGKLQAFYATENQPAIYILHLMPAEISRSRAGSHAIAGRLRLRASRVALAGDAATKCTVELHDGRVTTLCSRFLEPKSPADGCVSLGLQGYLLLPGLLNAHDHLEFGLYPNLGRGPYANSVEWAKDIHQSERARIAVHESIPRDVRLWWGAIRNLLCGVTTVCHHNPLHPELLHDDFPIRVVRDFGWAHSLAIDPQTQAKFQSTPDGTPFVLHACEGLDDRSANEIFELDRRGSLDARTVLVHGVALSRDAMNLLNQRGAALVCCPSSNRFLFGRTLSRNAIHSVRRLLLGSDSPLTATGDLLDELHIAHRELGISATDLYQMLLRDAASAFRLRGGEGSIRAGSVADFIAVRDRGLSPAETLANLTWLDVELVMVRGRVQLASENVFGRLPRDLSEGLKPLEVDGVPRWIRAPLQRLFREAQRALGNELKVGGKQVRHA
jgi:cytosine/adenosine deaminase-related metal-dependent hydrolase/ubiquinone/menaquinone biosynthesis C-methylase UbiE